MRWWSVLTLSFVPTPLRWLCFGTAGAFLGMAAYVLRASNAVSYLSDDPEACINCHIMTPQYSTWKHSSHGRVTNCNDCHVPHDNEFKKYWFKATDGGRHSAMFTLRMEPQVIEAHAPSKAVIQQNCIRCHQSNTENVSLPVHSGSDRPCIDCHREVPHGTVHSLSSTPNAAVPPLKPLSSTREGADRSYPNP